MFTVKVKEGYILVNGDMAYAKGCSWFFNPNAEGLASMGYDNLKTAKGALSRVKKNYTFDRLFGRLDPNNWKLITVRETFEREIK